MARGGAEAWFKKYAGDSRPRDTHEPTTGDRHLGDREEKVMKWSKRKKEEHDASANSDARRHGKRRRVAARDESVLSLAAADAVYQPKTEETRAAYESISERTKDDHGHDREQCHRDRERSRRGKTRGGEKDNRDRGKDREDREVEHGHRGKDRERDRGRESHRERDYQWRDRDNKGKDRERGKEDRDREKDRRDRDKEAEAKDHDRHKGKAREKESDNADRDRLRREREKEKDGRGKHDSSLDSERESHRERDYQWRDRDNKDKDRERGKEDRDDREAEAKDHDRHKGKAREKESGNTDRDRLRREREKEKDGRGKHDNSLDSEVVSKRAGGDEDGGGKHETSSKDHDEKPTSELEARLIKMKQERLKQKPHDASEIASWVSKSRRRNVEEKEKAARMSRQLEEQEDNIEDESEDEKDATHSGGEDLAGVKIRHGLDKVIEGGTVVLTLKDQNILADGDINEEMDMLENVEIGEQKQRDEAYKASKKRTAGVYEDKFSDHDLGYRKTILPQYDDPVEDEGVTLDEAEKKLEELRKRIEEGGSVKRTFEDLASSGKNSSDYFTPDEMLQFKKPKKKKSLRKREKLDLDALEAEAISVGLGPGDLGSRSDSKRQLAKEQEAEAEAEMSSSAYRSALAKAEEASKALRQEQILTVKPVEDDDIMVFGEEDYEDDLEKSLEQARKLALKRKEESTAVTGPQAVALMAIAANKKAQEDTQNSATVEPQENKVVITEMEFVLGLQFNEETQNPDAEDVFKDDEDIPTSVRHEIKPEIGGWTEIKVTFKDEQLASEEKEVIAPGDIIHERAVGKGLAGALKLLKERGTLKEGINDSGGSKEICIERTDEFGRIMTPKEAYRMFSHKFHGSI